jgi:hypothetical protein
MRWIAADVPNQTGRVVVITGANTGIGFEAAVRGGQHYGPGGLAEQRGHPNMVQSSAQSRDEDYSSSCGESPRNSPVSPTQ